MSAPSLSKQSLIDGVGRLAGPDGPLGAAGRVLWASACDTYAAIKLQMPASSTPAQLDAVAEASRGVALGLAPGGRLDSFIVEFVNDLGSVVHARRWGGMNAASSTSPNLENKGAPGTGTPAKAAGHTPIGGLRASPERQPTPQGGAPVLPGVKHVVAVGAGKGGVGKSTIALNLAVGLARKGHAVGLLDGDIYGPSMPTMLNLAGLDAMVLEGRLQPFNVHGVKCMTIGKLVDADKPLIWRGPMAHGAFKQLTEQTQWGELDYLIIDLPPGTGDVSLTMAQLLQLTGAVVVCTPQKVAQDDAVRAAKMFQQLGIEILGVVENMSYFVGDGPADTGKVYDLFGRGGAQMMAQRLNVPFLGSVPITTSLRVNSDAGDPTANFTGKYRAGTELARSFEELVRHLEGQVALAAMKGGQVRPTLTIS
jgi:ATP-binding protein involved in chromosome partitioning